MWGPPVSCRQYRQPVKVLPTRNRESAGRDDKGKDDGFMESGCWRGCSWTNLIGLLVLVSEIQTEFGGGICAGHFYRDFCACAMFVKEGIDYL